jgi:prevent-host-death family protein
MKLKPVSTDTLPLGEFKTHASRVLQRLQRARRPIVITQNGKPAAVLVRPAEFDRLRDQANFMKALQEGLEDSDARRLLDDEALGRELDAEFGPLEPR